MAHFAKLSSNNQVLEIHSVCNDVLLDNGVESEQKGIDFLINWSLDNHTNWKQTSFNTHGNVHLLGGVPLRKNYAVTNGFYNVIHDAFISPKEHDSWLINVDAGTFVHEAPNPPGPIPESANINHIYEWSETNYQSNAQTAWVHSVWDPTQNTFTQLFP